MRVYMIEADFPPASDPMNLKRPGAYRRLLSVRRSYDEQRDHIFDRDHFASIGKDYRKLVVCRLEMTEGRIGRTADDLDVYQRSLLAAQRSDSKGSLSEFRILVGIYRKPPDMFRHSAICCVCP